MTAHFTLLYAYSPSGHSEAAKALKTQFKLMDPAVAVSELVITADLHPFWGPMVTSAYLELIQKTPKLWDYLYDNQIVAQALDEFKTELTAMHRKKLREALKRLRTEYAVCTHALPCAMLAIEKQTGRMKIPLIAAITDFGVHAYWISEFVDLYLAPTEEVRDELARRGIDRARVAVTGIPIDPQFRRPPGKAEAKASLGFDPNRPVILITGGTKGIGPIRDIVFHLLSQNEKLQLSVICGTNRELFDWLQSKYPGKGPGGRVRVSGFVDNMAAQMTAADILVGKAGGITSSEAIACGLPLVILAPLPGQEERNSTYLVSRGAAKRVETQEELSEIVGQILSSGKIAEDLGRTALSIAHPDSAEKACRAMLNMGVRA